MQVHRPARGGSTIPRHSKRLKLLRATAAVAVVVMVVAVAALLVRGVGPATSGVGAQDANPRIGTSSAIIHDDAGNMER